MQPGCGATYGSESRPQGMPALSCELAIAMHITADGAALGPQQWLPHAGAIEILAPVTVSALRGSDFGSAAAARLEKMAPKAPQRTPKRPRDALESTERKTCASFLKSTVAVALPSVKSRGHRRGDQPPTAPPPAHKFSRS
eukprot:CAMPEP_0206287174 /NCGR_PEP_ID=MMETSP0106_2-20121207/974_1 /ASSEMBLY_ACC=CAM_ASM_000206 /TAXON_ID=81532 /ORGANISM="Acanthoeca-like sp., Strain 10tr" /LENGTH=140 /DNA_ID=CAMNT_0053717707 /DNA_START=519 /DNA_END=937 /DNA_ORIENTATION=-